jgi:hypothetical protein
MSSDNCILILKTKDGYRVGHFQAVDNLYWLWDKPENKDVVCVRLFEFFQKYAIIKDKHIVLLVAQQLYESAGGYVEYGIQTIEIDKTFHEIVVEAKKQIQKEITYVKEKGYHSIVDDLKDTLTEIKGWLATHE